MVVDLFDFRRGAPRGGEVDQTWGNPVCALTFVIRDLDAGAREDVVRLVQELPDTKLDQYTYADGRHYVTVETSADDWASAGDRLKEALAPLAAAAKKDVTCPAERALQFDPLQLFLGHQLVPLVDPAKGGEILDGIGRLRTAVASELGFIVPPVRVKDDLLLPMNSFAVSVRGHRVAVGEVVLGKLLALDWGQTTEPLENVAPAVDCPYGHRGYWVTAEERAAAEVSGYGVVTPTDMIISKLDEVIRGQADRLLGREDVYFLLSRLRERAPTLVKEVVPAVVTVPVLHEVLKALLRRGQSIRDLERIVETLSVRPDPNPDDVDARADAVVRALAPGFPVFAKR